MKDCKLLQSNVDCFHKWCLDNGMNLSVDKGAFIHFTRRTLTSSISFPLEQPQDLYDIYLMLYVKS